MNKIDGGSMDIKNMNIEQLRAIFPQVFKEGKIDFELLQNELGEYVESDREKYCFTWKGKVDSLKLAQKRSAGTLLPCKEESKNWNTTGNLYIEGDNLEVLKLLQGSYLNSIKMIYIDPPYNTGNDFVYTDDFADSLANYKNITGQVTKSNPESAGRYHTNWLNMMYPRLKIARNLLKDDGVIFISIDDNEVHNLRKICDDVFGEDNFITEIVWERSYAPINMVKHFSKSHDYILCYAKHIDNLVCNGLVRPDSTNAKYSNPDNDPRGLWRTDNLSVGPVIENKVYEIITPSGRKCLPPKGRCWLYTKERYEEMVKDNRIWFGADGDNVPAPKRFLNEVKQGLTPMTVWKYGDVGHSQDSMRELKEIFEGEKVFDYSKPVKLIKQILKLYTNENDIILDFFSGSATTAQAVMQLNVEDCGNRKFIMIQLPELCEEKTEAYKNGLKNICEIGKERIRRSANKLAEMLYHESETVGKKIENINIDDFFPEMKDASVFAIQLNIKENLDNLDTGFKVFKLDSSNLIKWNNSATEDVLEIEKRIIESMFYLVDGRSDLDMVYEIMLKYNLPLTLPVEEITVQGKKAYIIVHSDFKVLVCLDHGITISVAEELNQLEIGTFIFADRCFADANMLINVEEILKKSNKEMRLF